MKTIIKSSKDKNYVFCYGTLKKHNRNHYMMKDAVYIGNGYLHHMTMLDIGRYPALIPGNTSILGEVYCVDDEHKKELDIFEEVGSLYADKEAVVEVEDTSYLVHYYEMIESGLEYPLCKDVDNYYRVDSNEFVWYVCYGSNLLEERFMKYINRTTSKQKWLKSEEISIPYDMYYGGKSSFWSAGGVAYLDISKKGCALGKGYLITKEQYEEIKQQEGSSYSYKVDLGLNYDNVPMYSFTSQTHRKETLPCKEYVEIIAYGMCKLRNCKPKEIEQFLHYSVDTLDLSQSHIQEILKNK